VGADSSVG